MKEPTSLLDAFRLDGRVAAITGGARGIGLATARLFIAAGARTVLLDIDGAAAAEAAASLGPLASALPLDVSVEADVNRVFGEIVAGWPPSILEFPLAEAAQSDSALLRARLGVWRELVRWPSLTASAASVASESRASGALRLPLVR